MACLSLLGMVFSVLLFGFSPADPDPGLAPDSLSVPSPDPQAADSTSLRVPHAGDYLLVSKSQHLLRHFRDGTLVATYSVALGKNPADKSRVGDMATPLGSFVISGIKDSSYWTHDFGDGKGEIKGAYGPFFIGIKTSADNTRSGKAWTGIGIHGTHDPASIGTDASEGCIRMHNSDLLLLKAALKDLTQVPIDIIQ